MSCRIASSTVTDCLLKHELQKSSHSSPIVSRLLRSLLLWYVLLRPSNAVRNSRKSLKSLSFPGTNIYVCGGREVLSSLCMSVCIYARMYRHTQTHIPHTHNIILYYIIHTHTYIRVYIYIYIYIYSTRKSWMQVNKCWYTLILGLNMSQQM